MVNGESQLGSEIDDILRRLNSGVRAVRVTTHDSKRHEGLADAMREAAGREGDVIFPFYFDVLRSVSSEDSAECLCKAMGGQLYEWNKFRPAEIFARVKRRFLFALLGLSLLVEWLANFVDAAPVLGETPRRILGILQALPFPARAALYIAVLAVVVCLAWRKEPAEAPYVKKIDELRGSQAGQRVSSSEFLECLSQWMGTGRRYVVIVNNLNWAFDRSMQELLLGLLAKSNVSLVSIEDGRDIAVGDDGFFLAFQSGGLRIDTKDLPELDVCLLLREVLAAGYDGTFFKALSERLQRMGPDEQELAAIRDELETLHRHFEEHGRIRLPSLRETRPQGGGVEDRKVAYIREYFRTKNGLSASTTEPNALFVCAFHAHDLLGTGVSGEVFGSAYRMKDPGRHTFSDREIESKLRKLRQDLSEARGSRRIVWDDDAKQFAVLDPWVPKFVLSHPALFNDGELSFLREAMLEQSADYAKLFLMSAQCTESQFRRAWKALDSDAERVFFGIRRGIELRYSQDRPRSSQSDDAGVRDLLIAANRWFAEAWDLAIRQNLLGDAMTVNVFQSQFHLPEQTLLANPLETVCFPVAARMFGAGYLRDFDMERVLERFAACGEMLVATPYAKLHKRASEKLATLEVRHKFNRGEHRPEDIANSPLLRLLEHIEEDICVLLPRVPSAHVGEIPHVDVKALLGDGMNLQTRSLNVLLLWAVSIIHDHFYLSQMGKIVPRSSTDGTELEQIRKVVDAMHDELHKLRDAPKGYLDELKYFFQRANFLCLLRLCKACGIDVDGFAFPGDAEIAEAYRASFVGYEAIEHFFGASEVAFWESWFASRGITAKPGSEIEGELERLLHISQRILHYTYHETEILYASCIAHAALPPAPAYVAIHRFFASERHVPAYLELEFLQHLEIICFNGEFRPKAKLREECRKICLRIVDDYSERLPPSVVARHLLTVVRTYGCDCQERQEVLDRLQPFKGFLDDRARAVLTFEMLQRCCGQGRDEELPALKAEAEERLRPFPFEYLQYLVFAIDCNLPARAAKAQLESLEKDHKKLVDEHNTLAAELRAEQGRSVEAAAAGQGYVVRRDDPRLLAGTEHLDELSRAITALRKEAHVLQDSEPLYHELEDTLKAYRKRVQFTRNVRGEDFPARYVVAQSCHHLALHCIGRGHDGRARATEFFETALEQYVELEETLQAMRCLLELKYCVSRAPVRDRLREEAERILRMHCAVGTNLAEPNATREVLDCLLYDYFNSRSDPMRTDYDYCNNLKTKVTKNTNRDGTEFLSKNKLAFFDGDTTGLRRALARFYFNRHRGVPQETLMEDAGGVLTCGERSAAELTHSDIETMRTIIDHLRDKEQQTGGQNLEEVKALQGRLDDIQDAYRKHARAYIRETISALASHGADHCPLSVPDAATSGPQPESDGESRQAAETHVVSSLSSSGG